MKEEVIPKPEDLKQLKKLIGDYDEEIVTCLSLLSDVDLNKDNPLANKTAFYFAKRLQGFTRMIRLLITAHDEGKELLDLKDDYNKAIKASELELIHDKIDIKSDALFLKMKNISVLAINILADAKEFLSEVANGTK